MPSFSLKVNGVARNVDVQPDTPLLWVLRDTLQLTGTKFGCGAGLCGACSVHVDGALTRSCTLPVSQAAGKNVKTIEGLGGSGPHTLQEARIVQHALPCGNWQRWQIISASSLPAI